MTTLPVRETVALATLVSSLACGSCGQPVAGATLITGDAETFFGPANDAMRPVVDAAQKADARFDVARTADGALDASHEVDARIDARIDATEDGTAGEARPLMDGGSDATAALPAIRYVGRFDMSDPNGPIVDWSGARILARFMGTEVAATMTDTSFGGGNAFWDVTIDGVLQTTPLGLDQGQAIYLLAIGLAPGAHSIELWKRTEANVSFTQFGGFDFGKGKLLPPEVAPSRRIEFLGDSVSVGYGDEGDGPLCTFTPATEDDHVAFPALVAEALGADHQNISYSGCGVYWNYDRSNPEVFSQLYPRTRALVPGSTWNFANFVPDVVWITLGGNDWDQPNPGDPPPPLGAFEAAYDQLVTTVRANHPNAYIICSIAPSLNDDYPSEPPYMALTNMRLALANELLLHPNDTRLTTFEFARADAAELTGCASHPNVAEQGSLATQAIAFIDATVGWN